MTFLARLLIAAGIALAASITPPADAADRSQQFQAKGVGREKCSVLRELLQKKDQRAIELTVSWLDGYITSINTFRADTFDIAPWQDSGVIADVVRQLCERNPERSIAEVAPSLIEILVPGRLDARAEFVEAKAGDRTVRIYQPILRRAQEALIKQGFLKGTADGSFGPKTKTAFEAFQAKAGIPKSGVPDQETLFNLLMASQPS